MVTRDSPWPAGTPCWVDLGVSDTHKAIAFYTAQFGWDVRQGGPETGGYSIAYLDGRTVAGIGPKMGPPESPSAWTTYMATEDADATAAKVKGAGGQLLTDPMDVMDVGRMAIAVDTTGAAFGIWQARAHTGAQLANAPGTVTWNEQMSRDFEGAKAFYAAVFGYAYGDMSGDGFSYATLLLDGHEVGGIGGYPDDAPAGTPAAWTTYFGAADTDAAVAQAVKAGGRVIRPAADSPYGRTATVTDDQGAVFSLISMPPGE
ncbi:VOC family protein [Trebonia sp.]|uniref:VOC family protein n=1 Tax=Trebonia sp. TaxID=2767075 RepID=UPI0026226E8D|nr:VOC family protein [Trebonia sp.]